MERVRDFTDHRLVLEVAAGRSTLKAAAKKCIVPYRTAKYWQTLPEFRRAVMAARARYRERVAGRLAALMWKATRKLDGLLDSADDRVALRAVPAVYDAALEFRAAVDLDAQVQDLERLVREQAARRPAVPPQRPLLALPEAGAPDGSEPDRVGP